MNSSSDALILAKFALKIATCYKQYIVCITGLLPFFAMDKVPAYVTSQLILPKYPIYRNPDQFVNKTHNFYIRKSY